MIFDNLYEAQKRPEDILKNNNIEVQDVASDKTSYIVMIKDRSKAKQAEKLLKNAGFETYAIGKLIYIS